MGQAVATGTGSRAAVAGSRDDAVIAASRVSRRRMSTMFIVIPAAHMTVGIQKPITPVQLNGPV